MCKKTVVGIVIALFLANIAFQTPSSRSLGAETIVVPDNFPTIQDAINSAGEGDTIYVRVGVYSENINIEKRISLVGEDPSTTIIDGSGIDHVVNVTVDDVIIFNFTIRNSSRFEFRGLSADSYGGVYVDNCDNILILNCNITDNFVGVNLVDSSNSTVENCSITGNFVCGLSVHRSSSNRILANTVSNNGAGLLFWLGSNSNEIINNIVSFNELEGIHLMFSSSNNHLKENVMLQNGYNFGVNTAQKDTLESFINDIDTSNTVDGKPIQYLVNHHNVEVPPNPGFVALVNCTNVLLNNSQFQNNLQGILFAYTNNSHLENLNITNNIQGVQITCSFNNTLRKNVLTGNNRDFSITGSSIIDYIHNIDTSNVIDGKLVHYLVSQNRPHVTPQSFPSAGFVALINSSDAEIRELDLLGVQIAFTNSTLIERNNVTKNGVTFEWSHNNTLDGNIITSNYDGLALSESCNNTLHSNVFDDNWGGVRVSQSWGNVFYHNSFVNNKYHVQLWSPSSYVNSWDGGYPCGGNYWDNYIGQDRTKGTYQNETGVDGIGDTPHVIFPSKFDRYPLMHPYGSVKNLNTNLTYLTIQSAIGALETLSGHTVFVSSGVYFENVVIGKAVSIIGENRSSTIIDANYTKTVVRINVDNVTIIGFTIRNSGRDWAPKGIWLNGVRYCNISHNIIQNNRWGMKLGPGPNSLRDNKLIGNDYNLIIESMDISQPNDIDSSNTVDGAPIYHLVNQHYVEIPSGAGYVRLINCTNIVVQNLQIDRNDGLFIINSINCSIANNTFTENINGIILFNSSYNKLVDNTVTHNLNNIILAYSSYNVIVSNNLSNNGGVDVGVLSWGSLQFMHSHNNSILENVVADNFCGGVSLENSNSNLIFHNNFIDNGFYQAECNESANVWDNGCEGNFWSDYNGTDSDGDGIGDTPYIIDGNNQDICSLMNLYWNPADINHDLEVDIFDVVLACVAYTSTPLDLNWNCHGDIAEPYGVIDIFDIVMICASYGEEY